VEAQSIAAALGGGFAPLDSSLPPDIASGAGSPLMMSSAGATAGVGVSLGKMAYGTVRVASDTFNQVLNMATGGVFHDTPLMRQSWANNTALGNGIINAVSSPRETATTLMESIANRYNSAMSITDNDFQRSYQLGQLFNDVGQAGAGGIYSVRSLARFGASELRFAGVQDYVYEAGTLPERLARNPQAGAVASGRFVPVDANGVPLGASVPVRVLDVGTYAKQAANSIGDGLTPDHIPSFAAVRAFKEQQLGRELRPAEVTQLRNATNTIMVDTTMHQELSLTYGGRNHPLQIAHDSFNLRWAAERDLSAYSVKWRAQGYTPQQIEAAAQKLHLENIKLGLYK
jgi:hypothetical protein